MGMNFIKICSVFVLCCVYSARAAAPTFSSPTTTVDILESLIVGGLVVEVSATDADGDSLRYSLTTVSPADADDVFSVAPSGELTTLQSLDYESQTDYTLVVRVEANNEAAEQTVHINVINVNEAPEFPGDLIGATAENYATAGYTVTTIHAVDPDHTLDTVYTITVGNTEGHFLIGQTSGTVKVSSGTRLNRTVASAYALTIEASDKGTPPRTGTTTLVIGICGASALERVDFIFYAGLILVTLWQTSF